MAAQTNVPSNMTSGSESAWLAKRELFATLPRPALAKNGLARLRLRRPRRVETLNAAIMALAFPLLYIPLFLSHLLVGSLVFGALVALGVSFRKAYGYLAEYFRFAQSEVTLKRDLAVDTHICCGDGIFGKLKAFLTPMMFKGVFKTCATDDDSPSNGSGSMSVSHRSSRRPAMPARPQKRKAADDPGDNDGNDGDGNGGKRPKGSDGKPGQSYLAKIQATEAYFARFRAAYEGKDRSPLGSDGPVASKKLVEVLKPKQCAVIFSSETESRFAEAEGESWTYAYNVESQNPAIELRMGQNQEGTPFRQQRVLDINSEQMGDDPKRPTITFPRRLTIKNVNDYKLKNQLAEAGVPYFHISTSAQNTKILNSLKNKFLEDAVDVMIFKIKTDCPLWIRRPFALDNNGRISAKQDLGDSKLADLIEGGLNALTYITVIRPALEDERRFVDQFWDDQVQRCREKGIYWGYNLHRDSDYALEVLEGKLEAPYLPWFRLPKETDKLLSHPYKPFMTSMAEWEALLTIGLLHEIQHQRLLYKAVYSFGFGPEHTIKAWLDSKDATRIYFYVYAGHVPGVENPKVPVDTEFKLLYNGLQLDGGVAIKLPEGSDADIVLQFTLDDGTRLPWQFETGDEFQVKLDMTFNVEAAKRSLEAIQYIAKHASDADKKMLCSRPLQNATQRVPFDSLRTKLHATNLSLWNAITNWEGNLRLNQLQHQAIESCLQFLVNYIQGPPGTGKSEVAIDAAVLVASLGKNVVIASPTNGAGKSNAIKLAGTLAGLPEAMRDRIHPVYLPTQKESIERMYEHQGYTTESDRQKSDKVFDGFQLWRQVIQFARARKLDTQKLEVAERLLTAYDRLKTAPDEVSEKELEEFRKSFKTISNIYLRREGMSFIFITTCNNSAMLKQLDIECGLLLLDEAALATQYDFAVPLQIEHEAVAQLGDHLQVDPTVTSKDHNPAYAPMKVSNFERNVTDVTVDSTMLRIVYRFGETIADIVGNFGGYGGLASGLTKESAFYHSFKSFMLASPDYKPILHPRSSRYVSRNAKLSEEALKNDFHRICLNVKNGHSSGAHSGSSTVNYTNVDAILKFAERCIAADGISASDIGIGTPFVAQAQLFRDQIKIRGLSGIEVFTIGVSQGSEKKLWIACFTVANTTEPAFIGSFLSNWLRINVLTSRAQDALVMALNFDLMRPHLPSFYEQNPTWAYFLVDQLESGPMINVTASKTLPKDAEEFKGPENSWSLVQNPSDLRKLHGTFKKPVQDDFKKGANGGLAYKTEPDDRYLFSSREEKVYLKELRSMRKDAKEVTDKVLESEEKWQEKRKMDLEALHDLPDPNAMDEDTEN